jgi:hypothetical protein
MTAVGNLYNFKRRMPNTGWESGKEDESSLKMYSLIKVLTTILNSLSSILLLILSIKS